MEKSGNSGIPIVGQHPAGKYGAEAEDLAKKLKAMAVIVIVIEADRGSGFAIIDSTPGGKITKEVPGILRLAADDLEQQQRRQSLH